MAALRIVDSGVTTVRAAEKISLACAAILTLSCVASILVLSFTDVGASFFKPAFEVIARSRSVSALSQKYPFTPPPDGIVSESRLEAYLAVCERAKPASEALEAWLHGPRGGRGPARVARRPFLRGEGASLASAFFLELARGLDAQRMSFDEFLWIRNRLQFGSAVSPDRGHEEELRLEMEKLRELAADPQTPPDAKKSLEQHIRSLDALPWAPGPTREANRALYARHQGCIEASRLPDRAVTLVSDFAVSNPGEARTIVLENDPGAAPAPRQR
jgi:hypothetical protein